MSDELPPPPLRLKSRLKPETETGTAAPENPSTPDKAEVPATQSELPRIKLRPKLNPPTAASGSSDLSVPAVVPPTPPALKPRLSIAEVSTAPVDTLIPAPTSLGAPAVPSAVPV